MSWSYIENKGHTASKLGRIIYLNYLGAYDQFVLAVDHKSRMHLKKKIEETKLITGYNL